MASPISIKLRCASWQQLSTIYKRDLSRGAIFLRSANPPAMGTPVRIDLTLPTESMIVLSGTIHDHVPEGGLGGRGPGVDVKLASIPQSAMWLIETALASAQRDQRQAPASVPPQATAGVGPIPTAAVPPPGDAALDDGRDVAAAEDELVAALASELESLKRLNPFQVLGVGYEASDAEVRAAFGELTKRYHPDRYTRYPSVTLRQHAAEIFILIRDAYRRLSDDRSRSQVLNQMQAPGRRAATPPPIGAPGVMSTAAMPAIPAPPTSSTSGSGPPPPPGAPGRGARPGTPLPRAATPPPIVIPPIAPAGAPAALPPSLPTSPTVASPNAVHHSSPASPASLAGAAGAAGAAIAGGADGPLDYSGAEALLDQGKYDEALAIFKIYARRGAGDRLAKAGVELAEGLRALAQRDRLEAAQRFESVLELDPSNERAARELAEMRRQATNERKGLLSRLLGKKE